MAFAWVAGEEWVLLRLHGGPDATLAALDASSGRFSTVSNWLARCPSGLTIGELSTVGHCADHSGSCPAANHRVLCPGGLTVPV